MSFTLFCLQWLRWTSNGKTAELIDLHQRAQWLEQGNQELKEDLEEVHNAFRAWEQEDNRVSNEHAAQTAALEQRTQEVERLVLMLR